MLTEGKKKSQKRNKNFHPPHYLEPVAAVRLNAQGPYSGDARMRREDILYLAIDPRAGLEEIESLVKWEILKQRSFLGIGGEGYDDDETR